MRQPCKGSSEQTYRSSSSECTGNVNCCELLLNLTQKDGCRILTWTSVPEYKSELFKVLFPITRAIISHLCPSTLPFKFTMTSSWPYFTQPCCVSSDLHPHDLVVLWVPGWHTSMQPSYSQRHFMRNARAAAVCPWEQKLSSQSLAEPIPFSVLEGLVRVHTWISFPLLCSPVILFCWCTQLQCTLPQTLIHFFPFGYIRTLHKYKRNYKTNKPSVR